MRNTPSRWMVLLAILLNIAYNAVYTTLGNLPSIKLVTEQYSSLFTPAGYAFSIWGIIYLSFIVYGIFQLIKNDEVYDRLAIPMIIANLLSILWIWLYTTLHLAASVIVILGMLACSIILFLIAVKKAGSRSWLSVPFQLFAGWLSVASIANISIWLESINWNMAGLSEPIWTMIMIVVATLLGVFVAIIKRGWLFTLVIAWAALAIYMALKMDDPEPGNVALAASIISVLAAAYAFFRIKQKG